MEAYLLSEELAQEQTEYEQMSKKEQIVTDALTLLYQKKFKNWDRMIAQALAYVAVKVHGLTYDQAGELFNKHPTTIRRNFERAEQQIDK